MVWVAQIDLNCPDQLNLGPLGILCLLVQVHCLGSSLSCWGTLTELWVSLCPGFTSAVLELTPWMDPSPDSSPVLSGTVDGLLSPAQACLGPALQPVREGTAFAVRICCSKPILPCGAVSLLLLFGRGFI